MSSPDDHTPSAWSFKSDSFRLINKFKKFELISPNYEMIINNALLMYIERDLFLKSTFYVHMYIRDELNELKKTICIDLCMSFSKIKHIARGSI